MVRAALAECPPMPQDLRKQLVLGVSGFEGESRTFELYIPGPRPEDAVVVARASLSSADGEGSVEVFPERWTER